MKAIDGDKVIEWMTPKGITASNISPLDTIRIRFKHAMREGRFDFEDAKINRREADCCANCIHLEYDDLGCDTRCGVDEDTSIELIDVCELWEDGRVIVPK